MMSKTKYLTFLVELKVLKIGFFVFLMLGLYLVFGCTKTENKTTYQSVEIAGNKAPNYNGATQTQINGYINRAFIDLLGREATTLELASSQSTLQSNPKDSLVKDQFIRTLESKRDYYKRIFELTSAKLIQGNDSLAVAQQIISFNYQFKLVSTSGYNPALSLYFQLNNYYLRQLVNATDTLMKNQIDLSNYYKLFLNSYFYDQINMGAENYTKAIFQNLFLRLPSVEELTQASNLYDNKIGTLFQTSGSNKADLIKIVTSTTEFYQGYVIDAYLQFIQRKPTSIELKNALDKLLADKDYKKIKRVILTSKEYAGF